MVARKNYLEDYLGTGKATTFEGQRFNFNTIRMPEMETRPSYVTNPFSSCLGVPERRADTTGA